MMNPVDDVKQFVTTEIEKAKLDAEIVTVQLIIDSLQEKLDGLKAARAKL